MHTYLQGMEADTLALVVSVDEKFKQKHCWLPFKKLALYSKFWWNGTMYVKVTFNYTRLHSAIFKTLILCKQKTSSIECHKGW